METVLHVLHPDFLLRNSVYMSVLVGAVVPLVGVLLVLRRLVFLGLPCRRFRPAASYSPLL
jgi:ABC-type Mn2+/Zn2+ transport system permease subunit